LGVGNAVRVAVQLLEEMHNRCTAIMISRLMQAKGEFIFVMIRQDICLCRVKAAEQASGVVLAGE
jgi:hypothetical protein